MSDVVKQFVSRTRLLGKERVLSIVSGFERCESINNVFFFQSRSVSFKVCKVPAGTSYCL